MTTLQRVTEFAGVTVNGHSPIRVDLSRNDFPRLFAALGYQTGAEIGVWRGQFSEVLCLGIPGLRLLCVDPWSVHEDYHERKNDARRLNDAYKETRDRLSRFHCAIERKTSLEAAARVPDGSLDFVYIDGNHRKSFVMADLAAWTPKVRSGGCVCGHDYGTPGKSATIEVKDAVDEFVAKHQIAPWFLTVRDKSQSFLWVKA